jgi:hypothetical protein
LHSDKLIKPYYNYGIKFSGGGFNMSASRNQEYEPDIEMKVAAHGPPPLPTKQHTAAREAFVEIDDIMQPDDIAA